MKNSEHKQEYLRKWREEHRQHQRDYAAEYRLKFPGKVRAAKRRYHTDNRERYLYLLKRERERHREQRRAYWYEYRKKHHADILARNALWRKKHRKQLREKSKAYKLKRALLNTWRISMRAERQNQKARERTFRLAIVAIKDSL